MINLNSMEEGSMILEGCVADQNKKPIKGTEKYFECDTVLFSVGLIPENELSKETGVQLSNATKGAVVYQNRETNIDGIFACGNVLHVHDLVDFVSEEAETAGESAAIYALNGGKQQKQAVDCLAGENVGYVLPQRVDKNDEKDVKLFFRVRKPLNDCTVTVSVNGQTIIEKKRKIVRPGEMESVILKKDKLINLDGDITVSIAGVSV